MSERRVTDALAGWSLDLQRQAPSRAQRAARLAWCPWCASKTPHLLRSEADFVCLHHYAHDRMWTYRLLATSFADAAEYPGCICAPGEVSRFVGRPDGECLALEHRP